jgi:hypothetical protein
METGRLVGNLEAKVEGVQKTLEHHDKRFDRMEGKLDTLLSDKWKRHGAIVVVSGIMSTVVSIVIALIRTRS